MVSSTSSLDFVSPPTSFTSPGGVTEISGASLNPPSSPTKGSKTTESTTRSVAVPIMNEAGKKAEEEGRKAELATLEKVINLAEQQWRDAETNVSELNSKVTVLKNEYPDSPTHPILQNAMDLAKMANLKLKQLERTSENKLYELKSHFQELKGAIQEKRLKNESEHMGKIFELSSKLEDNANEIMKITDRSFEQLSNLPQKIDTLTPEDWLEMLNKMVKNGTLLMIDNKTKTIVMGSKTSANNPESSYRAMTLNEMVKGVQKNLNKTPDSLPVGNQLHEALHEVIREFGMLEMSRNPKDIVLQKHVEKALESCRSLALDLTLKIPKSKGTLENAIRDPEGNIHKKFFNLQGSFIPVKIGNREASYEIYSTMEKDLGRGIRVSINGKSTMDRSSDSEIVRLNNQLQKLKKETDKLKNNFKQIEKEEIRRNKEFVDTIKETISKTKENISTLNDQLNSPNLSLSSIDEINTQLQETEEYLIYLEEQIEKAYKNCQAKIMELDKEYKNNVEEPLAEMKDLDKKIGKEQLVYLADMAGSDSALKDLSILMHQGLTSEACTVYYQNLNENKKYFEKLLNIKMNPDELFTLKNSEEEAMHFNINTDKDGKITSIQIDLACIVSSEKHGKISDAPINVIYDLEKNEIRYEFPPMVKKL